MTKLSQFKENLIIAKDKLSNFSGYVTGHADYITGCDQYLLQPLAVNGDWKDARWFDEGRLHIIQTGEDPGVQAEENGCDIPAPVK